MEHSSAVQTSHQYSDNLMSMSTLPRWYDPFAPQYAYGENPALGGFDIKLDSNMPKRELRLVIGDRVQTLQITSYRATQTADGDLYVEIEAMAPPVVQDIDVTFTLDAQNNIDHHVYGVEDEVKAHKERLRLRYDGEVKDVLVDGCNPWVPSPEEMREIHHIFGLDVPFDPSARLTPSASKDMTCKPQPRYGWRG